MWRFVRLVLGVVILAGVALAVWGGWRDDPPPAPPAPLRGQAMVAAAPAPAARYGCGSAPAFAAAAAANGQSLTTAPWSVFHRPETGWAVYAPLAAHEIGTGCPGDAPGFAQALAAWQGGHGLAPSGIMDAATLDALRIVWLSRRPFVIQTRGGVCPPGASPGQLEFARPDEGYGGKPIQLTSGTLAAYRDLVAAARAESPEVRADPHLLQIVSGFRDPDAAEASCLLLGDCGTPARANCSAHRTGMAMDLYLGAAPGFGPASADDPNRLFLAATPAYGWLVRNAARFGFEPYPFEPWHWEWTGAEAPRGLGSQP